MTERYLIVGLGNSGRDYKKNRHNIGFQVVDHFAARHGMEFTRQQSNAFISTGNAAGKSIILAKPQTFMNRSGSAVAPLQKFYKIPLENLMIIYDELDLPLGTIRLKPDGSAGGQNGIKDIIARLGTNEFPRMRIGINRPPGKMDPAAYVLQDFGAEQVPVIQETYDRASDAIETWLRDGIELAMSRHNAPPPEKKAP
jgi:peptidyl-tRNA hydrolase, PTH1 family